jgi:hypothetical protein
MAGMEPQQPANQAPRIQMLVTMGQAKPLLSDQEAQPANKEAKVMLAPQTLTTPTQATLEQAKPLLYDLVVRAAKVTQAPQTPTQETSALAQLLLFHPPHQAAQLLPQATVLHKVLPAHRARTHVSAIVNVQLVHSVPP